MVFSSPVFLFFYLPAVLLLYYAIPARWRNLPLLVGSLVFYAWGEPVYVILMVGSTIVGWLCGLIIARCREKGRAAGARAALAAALAVLLGLLFFFKYWDWVAGASGILPVFDLALPIGISFYTFQILSYVIDVYRGGTAVQRNVLRFGTYVTLFPQLIAGPIVRYADVADQLTGRTYAFETFASGVTRFTVGLAKKVLLANSFGALWALYSTAAAPSAAGAWLGLLAFTFQIYFDFSGYSDMAIGLGRMLGFAFLENFNYPYLSRSVTEFWRRWHISLSTWFREYLYIPLGGNRHGKVRWLFAMTTVWACTGLWHGASLNFLCWGLYFLVLLASEKLFLQRVLERLPRVLQHLYALLAITLGWALFALEDFSALGRYLQVLFTGPPIDSDFLYYLVSYLPLFVIASVAATPLGARVWRRLPERVRQIAAPVLVVLGLVLCTAFIVSDSYNPFLYFRF